MVVKAVRKAVEYRKVVIVTEKPAGFTIEETCIAGYCYILRLRVRIKRVNLILG